MIVLMIAAETASNSVVQKPVTNVGQAFLMISILKNKKVISPQRAVEYR